MLESVHVRIALMKKDICHTAQSITSVVSSGLCIGCGLCESVTDGRVFMQMTKAGSLRPNDTDDFSKEEEQILLAACPGVSVSLPDSGSSGSSDSSTSSTSRSAPLLYDEVWGHYRTMQYAWAANADVRFRAATGGVLTALGVHLIKTQQVDFILHIKSDEAQPCRSRYAISRTAQEVISASASRYAPTAVLAGFYAALKMGERFAIIAKPCDISAVNNLAKCDGRVDQYCIFRLSLVCGGQSRFSKTRNVLNEYGVKESEVTVFRYRGYGNPGRTRIETKKGAAFEKTYDEMWGEEGQWDIESRCKVCPDALGEGADVTAADVWANANPTGEDAGINGIVVYSKKGERLVESAVAENDLTVGDFITADVFSSFQPHQVHKKLAMQARLEGLQQSNYPVIEAKNLRLAILAKRLDEGAVQDIKEATIARVQQGKFNE